MEETDDEWLKEYRLHSSSSKPQTQQHQIQQQGQPSHHNQRSWASEFLLIDQANI